MNQSETSTSSEVTHGVDTIDPMLVRARRNARHILSFFTCVFVVTSSLAIATVVHNNRLEHYPAVVDFSPMLMAAGAGGLILSACWFAWTRLKPPLVHATWVVAWGVAAMSGIAAVGVVHDLRPLVGSASYDTAVQEFGDTFSVAARLTDEEVAASKLIGRVASDEPATTADVRAAIDACDALIWRLTADAGFLENWPQVCREIMRKHGVSERRIEWYARRMEAQNDTSSLLESNAQLAILLQARKLDLRGRLATMEQGAATPTEDGEAGSLDK